MGQTLHVANIAVDTKKFEVINGEDDAVVSANAPKKQVEETEEVTTTEEGSETSDGESSEEATPAE